MVKYIIYYYNKCEDMTEWGRMPIVSILLELLQLVHEYMHTGKGGSEQLMYVMPFTNGHQHLPFHYHFNIPWFPVSSLNEVLYLPDPTLNCPQVCTVYPAPLFIKLCTPVPDLSPLLFKLQVNRMNEFNLSMDVEHQKLLQKDGMIRVIGWCTRWKFIRKQVSIITIGKV